MASDWAWEIPWSTIRPNAQTIINYHVAKYTGKVLFEFVTEKAWPVGCLVAVTGAVTSGMLWWSCWRADNHRSWILQALAAIITSGAWGVEYVATLDMGRRTSLINSINISLHKMVVWKAIANDAAAANMEKYIHTLFNELNTLNGPRIPALVASSIVGFLGATIIYPWAKKRYNKDYKIENDKIFSLMVVNVALAFLFWSRIQEEVIIKAKLVL